jgi:hypothetical protein
MKPPEHESGATVASDAAIEDPSRPKPDCHSEAVKPEQMAFWLDHAIARHERASNNSREFNHLGLWLRWIRRALP